jgi:hypothetical protein
MFTSLRRGLTALLAAAVGFAFVWQLATTSIPPLTNDLGPYAVKLLVMLGGSYLAIVSLCVLYAGGVRWDMPAPTIPFVLGFVAMGLVLGVVTAVVGFHPATFLMALAVGTAAFYGPGHAGRSEPGFL